MDSSLGIKTIKEQQHPHQSNNIKKNQQQKQNQQSGVPANENNNKPKCGASVRDLELFFKNGLYNSCQATDELMKSIENSQDENAARKALDFYQRHYTILERPWDHVNFMYGLGLIYMHFNAYNWAIKSFREAIYVQPSFSRSRDIHTRLGLIFKATGRYKLSEKHFKLAINDTGPNCGTCTKFELQFHLAHLYELQGNIKQASDEYEKLLQEKDLPPKLCANIQRQLGWIHYVTSSKDPSLDSNEHLQAIRNNFYHQQHNSTDIQKIDAALNYLNASLRTDNDSNTSYYLGRCLTNVGRFQDAFASYRSVIDREESTADTWCSIGVLYHRQNQPWDALQAYIRSVQFDKKHAVAWMNLGILYESHNHFRDALKCYQHVLRSSSNSTDKSLRARIKYILRHLAEIEQTSSSNNGKSRTFSDKLLSLEDLWNLESKTSSEPSSSSNNESKRTSNSTTQNTNTSSNPSRALENFKFGTNPTTNHELFLSQPRVSPKEADPKQQTLTNGPITSGNNLNADAAPTNNHTDEPNNGIASKINSKRELEINMNYPDTPSNNHNGLSNDCKIELKSHINQEFNQQSLESNLDHALINGASKDSGISSNSSTYADSALVPSQHSDISPTNPFTANQIISICKSSPKPKKIDINLSNDDCKPPCLFTKTPIYPPPSHEKLFPSPPSIFLETKKDLASKKLQDICQSNPISIVRNMATVLKLDLGLFSTKTLVESNPDQQIDIISHLSSRSNCEYPEEDNVNLWSCERQNSLSTISRYATYQVASLRESLQDEIDGKSKSVSTREFESDSNESCATNARKYSYNNTNGQSLPGTSSNYSQFDRNQNLTPKTGPVAKKFKRDDSKVIYVRSADKIDLSDEKRWRPQLNELNKLPHFVKCVSASNMLTHIGTSVPGLNTIVMNMHVPGCRVTGNQTPNNFCPVYINTGPGDYEWCAVSAQYEQDLSRLCNRNGYDIDDKGWWPRISEFQKYNIPVYRFSQRPGDLVWVNSGTIYWIHVSGWANNIQWNVGPLCARQYRLASEKIEVNKLLFKKSEVPMVQTSWNIVMNINIITDDELFKSLTDVLRRSLRYCCLIKELLEESKRDIDLSDDERGPKYAQFCNLCETEIFNITFTRQQDKSLHCVECARRSDGSFSDYDIKQDYDLGYLTKLYDSFIDTRKKFLARQERIMQQQEQQQ